MATLPKPSETRRRRNSPPDIPLEGEPRKAPALGRGFTAATRAWWTEVWRSPMAARWLDGDVPALRRLAQMIDEYERQGGTGALLAEIRQLEDRFGLTPAARARLHWVIANKPDPSADELAPRRSARERVAAVDPSAVDPDSPGIAGKPGGH